MLAHSIAPMGEAAWGEKRAVVDFPRPVAAAPTQVGLSDVSLHHKLHNKHLPAARPAIAARPRSCHCSKHLAKFCKQRPLQ